VETEVKQPRCTECGFPEWRHERTMDAALMTVCWDYKPPRTRERAAYRYRDQRLAIVWYTSVPTTDEAAFEYASLIASWGYPEPRYIEYLDFGDHEYHALGEVEYEDR
jgi:hypothetical protein